MYPFFPRRKLGAKNDLLILPFLMVISLGFQFSSTMCFIIPSRLPSIEGNHRARFEAEERKSDIQQLKIFHPWSNSRRFSIDINIQNKSTKYSRDVSEKATGVSSADLDWPNLGFEFRATKSFMKFTWKDGEWNDGELVEGEPYVKVHIAATALHYGQAIFEGLKAFAWKDGSVNIFRPEENAKRLAMSAERLLMPKMDEERFVSGVKRVVKDNAAYVPPYGSNGSLYIRPLMFGSGPRIGLSPADEYTLLIMVIPVGDYYKGGIKPVPALVIDDFDRAAPKGVGHVKVAGNYAADMLPNSLSKKKGFPIGLYLDAKTNTLVEEFSTSNFVGITRDNRYVTPKSPSVLPSITNKSLMTLAEDEGLMVEQRDIGIREVQHFDEVVACGTAVVVTPVDKIVYGENVYKIGQEKQDGLGKTFSKLYSRVRGIQNGEEEDKFKWMVKAI